MEYFNSNLLWSLHKKQNFSLGIFFQDTADLVIFTDEIPNREFLFFVQSMVWW